MSPDKKELKINTLENRISSIERRQEFIRSLGELAQSVIVEQPNVYPEHSASPDSGINRVPVWRDLAKSAKKMRDFREGVVSTDNDQKLAKLDVEIQPTSRAEFKSLRQVVGIADTMRDFRKQQHYKSRLFSKEGDIRTFRTQFQGLIARRKTKSDYSLGALNSDEYLSEIRNNKIIEVRGDHAHAIHAGANKLEKLSKNIERKARQPLRSAVNQRKLVRARTKLKKIKK